MKIWLDALTPKQVLFSEYIMRRGAGQHTFLFTSRRYKEAEELASIRGLKPTYVGKFGGGGLASKLDASLERLTILSGMVQEFAPDISICFGSPEAARISYGLGIPLITFANTPYAEAANRLTAPLSTRILTPSVIPKADIARYGIEESRIISYNALDEAALIQNPPAQWDPAKAGIPDGRTTILFRTYETQAAYVTETVDMSPIIDALLENFPRHNIVVSGRYHSQIRHLRDRHPGCIVLNDTVDSGALLGICDVFVGSGTTMTTEAALRGVRTISYQVIPTYAEAYLAEQGALYVARTPSKIVQKTKQLLNMEQTIFRRKGAELTAGMDDIYQTLEEQITQVCK